ncbi:MAG: nickel pincer cofactor biosynthesis protein LarB [Limnochordia bacterium]|jgi:NCAIR mutase (PurE)-related protein
MDEKSLRSLLKAVQAGSVPVEEAFGKLKDLSYEELEYAKIDHHRALRKGFPEVVFCQGKTPEQVVEICRRLKAQHPLVLATRAESSLWERVKEAIPEASYHPQARIIQIGSEPPVEYQGTIVVLSAGTADIPVAEEACLTARAMGHRVERIYDVGVAGMHRLLEHRERLNQAHVIIVVAGMEGALASVVGGLVDKPVIAVPTSIGYGAHFQGLAALLSMLNTCASGVAVVNIDNGFGAGYMAATINRLVNQFGKGVVE